MITTAAQRAGFGGGVVVDYPNSTKKRKMYLCLMVGSQAIPKALGDNEMEVDGEQVENSKGGGVRNEARRKREAILAKKRGGKDNSKKGTVDKKWILDKKALYRQRGKEGVPRDSKVCRNPELQNGGCLTDAWISTVLDEEEETSILSRALYGLLQDFLCTSLSVPFSCVL